MEEGEGGEERPSGHFVPESPKNSISARCQNKGGGSAGKHPLPPCPLEIRFLGHAAGEGGGGEQVDCLLVLEL